MNEIKFWCDPCRWPSRRAWIYVSERWIIRGHRTCLETLSACIETEKSMVTKTDWRIPA